MSWQLAVDVTLIAMLALAVVVIFRFERQLALVRRNQHELDRLAMTFREATAGAEDSIGRLKDQAAALQRQHRAALQLSSDLQDLIERGTNLADRLEAAVRQGRTPPPAAGRTRVVAEAAIAASAPGSPSPAPIMGQPPNTPRQPDHPPRSAAERALLQALQASDLAERTRP